MWKIPFFSLSYDEREENAVQEVLRSRWLTQGDRTAQFEQKFANMLNEGAQGHEVQCIAVANCTAALHMALLCADVKPGDEVIVPALTFVADANVVQHCGAKTVFADCTSYSDWNISAQSVEACMTERTKAVIAVHYAGMPCAMQELRELCESKDVILIEDSAHAIGATYRGQQCGTLAHMSCFSFFSNKNLSTGEGGMFASADVAILEKARLLRSHGMTSLTIDRWKNLSSGYDVLLPGYNYRMDEIRSALGIVQLSKINDMNSKRKVAVEYYNRLFDEQNDVYPFWKQQNPDCAACHHIYPVLLPADWDRTKFLAHMKDQRIQVSKHYECIPNFTAYNDQTLHVPVAQELSRRIVTLPLFPAIRPEDIRLVVDSIKAFHEPSAK